MRHVLCVFADMMLIFCESYSLIFFFFFVFCSFIREALPCTATILSPFPFFTFSILLIDTGELPALFLFFFFSSSGIVFVPFVPFESRKSARSNKRTMILPMRCDDSETVNTSVGERADRATYIDITIMQYKIQFKFGWLNNWTNSLLHCAPECKTNTLALSEK